MELVAGAARRAGHDVRLIDLQVETSRDNFRLLKNWRPDVVALSCNYLPNVPEIIDLAKMTNASFSKIHIVAGGPSLSFVAREVLEHAEGAIDTIVKGEGESVIGLLLNAIQHDPSNVHRLPSVVTREAEGPPPEFVTSLDEVRPARNVLRHRRKYFLGVMDPCASIELTRGCPWDCSFCSAWTFYGRSYRPVSPEVIVEELAGIREPGVFLVDDVAFIQAEHGMAIGEAIARRGIKKSYYLETRGDVLLRNQEVFRLWKKLGMKYMFIGLEAIDQEGLIQHRNASYSAKILKHWNLSTPWASPWPLTLLPIPTGIRIVLKPCVNGVWRSRRWSILVPTRPIPALKRGTGNLREFRRGITDYTISNIRCSPPVYRCRNFMKGWSTPNESSIINISAGVR